MFTYGTSWQAVIGSDFSVNNPEVDQATAYHYIVGTHREILRPESIDVRVIDNDAVGVLIVETNDGTQLIEPTETILVGEGFLTQASSARLDLNNLASYSETWTLQLTLDIDGDGLLDVYSYTEIVQEAVLNENGNPVLEPDGAPVVESQRVAGHFATLGGEMQHELNEVPATLGFARCGAVESGAAHDAVVRAFGGDQMLAGKLARPVGAERSLAVRLRVRLRPTASEHVVGADVDEARARLVAGGCKVLRSGSVHRPGAPGILLTEWHVVEGRGVDDDVMSGFMYRVDRIGDYLNRRAELIRDEDIFVRFAASYQEQLIDSEVA